ncbi:cobalt ECF transporter T component CbiQ [Clostridia bacterium]|nr:cobalt ECF transporter T component CbiQ [Clostridia bacterium]
MADIRNKIHQIYSLEQLSGGNTAVHLLHPMAKLLATIIFIVTVVSFGRYSFGAMLPYLFYSAIIMAVAEIPYSILLKRVLIALPFCLFVGISNLFLITNTSFTVAGIEVSFGVVSLFTLLFRTYLSVMAVLILVAVTPFFELTAQMRRLKVPAIFVTMFEMTYRYIGVLLEEVTSMRIAYTLRSTQKKAIDIRHMGSFVGGLLLRSFDRAERVYSAMKCRGYALETLPQKKQKFTQKDWLYLLATSAFCMLFRIFDFQIIFAKLLGGLF